MMEPQLRESSRLCLPERLVGVAPETHRPHTGASLWISFILRGIPPDAGEPARISPDASGLMP